MYLRQSIQTVLGLVFLVSSSLAISNTEFTYNVIDGGIEVTGCVDGCPSDLVIPEEIDGYVVTAIGGGAFSSWGLNSVELPNTLVSLGGSAFLYNNLISVEIPSNVTFIGGHAFDNNRLTGIQIPAGISVIHESAFRRNQIEELIIPSNIRGIRANAFNDNNISNLIIPDSVNSIADGAFTSNNLVNIKFLSTPMVIYDSPFSNNPLAKITYCQNTDSQWDDVIIEGITPQLDENCDDSNEHGDDYGHDEHEEEHHGDEEYCYPYGDEHEEHEDEHDHDGHCYSAIDLDQNGSFEALTDALMLIRYAFGLRGNNLINGAIATDANVTTAEEIELQIQMLLP